MPSPAPEEGGGIESSCWGRKSSGKEGKGRREGKREEREGNGRRREREVKKKRGSKVIHPCTYVRMHK